MSLQRTGSPTLPNRRTSAAWHGRNERKRPATEEAVTGLCLLSAWLRETKQDHNSIMSDRFLTNQPESPQPRVKGDGLRKWPVGTLAGHVENVA